MATKRRQVPSQNPRLNYRPSMNDKTEPKGTKPTINPTSVKEIFALIILFVCKKILFYNIKHRIFVYLGCLFMISLVADVATLPKNYWASSNNLINRVFVKYAWAWNLLLSVPYVGLTSFIYCCGEKDKILKHHLSRIAIATGFWYFWTELYHFIEGNFGKCSVVGSDYNTKGTCLREGHHWFGFDISGHAFILIYGSLFLLEESRSIVNWDSIKDYIRLEDHYRSTRDTSANTNPLRTLSSEQFEQLQKSYEKYTPYIRALFVGMTFLSLLWDFMLLCTMLYYHVMIEKLLAGIAAIATWYCTYYLWYNSNSSPKLPAEGCFKYIKPKINTTTNAAPSSSRRRTGSIVNGNQPTFMGRPLYSNRSDGNVSDIEDANR